MHRPLSLVLALVLSSSACSDEQSSPNAETISDSTQAATCAKCDPATTFLKNGVCYAKPPLPTCGPIAPGSICVTGVVRSLADAAAVAHTRVWGFDPLAFAQEGMGAQPLATPIVSDALGQFAAVLPLPAIDLVLLAVDDVAPASTHVPTAVMSSATPGATLHMDLYAADKALVGRWDTQAGLAAGTLEADGAYVARFVGATGQPVAGVELVQGSGAAPNAFYLKGNMSTVGAGQVATDAKTGTAVQHTTSPSVATYTGQGGGVTWKVFPAAPAKGAVLVQTFTPQ
jgi:hypothetical protein